MVSHRGVKYTYLVTAKCTSKIGVFSHFSSRKFFHQRVLYQCSPTERAEEGSLVPPLYYTLTPSFILTLYHSVRPKYFL